jgi:hypothetical protein
MRSANKGLKDKQSASGSCVAGVNDL